MILREASAVRRFSLPAWPIVRLSRPVRYGLAVLLLTALGLAAWGVYRVDFSHPHPWYYPGCPFYKVTGYYCIGCGGTRAVHDLLHGRLLSAFGHNPLLFFMAPPLGYVVLGRLKGWVTGKPWPEVTLPAWAIMAMFFLFLAYWIGRNLPVYPLTLLAP